MNATTSRMKKQFATIEFCQWLATTSFAGKVWPGQQWDTEVAWPTPETMDLARDCFELFGAGKLKAAEHALHKAQADLEGR